MAIFAKEADIDVDTDIAHYACYEKPSEGSNSGQDVFTQLLYKKMQKVMHHQI